MTNNKITAFNRATTKGAATPERRRKATRSDAIDRSPATGTTVSTSEEVLAVANDRSNAAAGSPSYDEIAQAAYERYLSRGGEHGQDIDDWMAAERDLNERRDR